jgi:hypothetical protein
LTERAVRKIVQQTRQEQRRPRDHEGDRR